MSVSPLHPHTHQRHVQAYPRVLCGDFVRRREFARPHDDRTECVRGESERLASVSRSVPKKHFPPDLPWPPCEHCLFVLRTGLAPRAEGYQGSTTSNWERCMHPRIARVENIKKERNHRNDLVSWYVRPSGIVRAWPPSRFNGMHALAFAPVQGARSVKTKVINGVLNLCILDDKPTPHGHACRA